MTSQTVDRAVSRAKFDREIEQFRLIEADYRKRGIFLVEAAFPTAMILFAATKVRGVTPIAAAVVIDFTDYDLRPLSVTFVDPFTKEPLKTKELRIQMVRCGSQPALLSPQFVQMLQQQGVVQASSLIQSNGPEERPFICLPGIREYHDNPAHSGDPWLLHRASGEGSLAFIVDKIWTYGTNQISELQVQVQVSVTGFIYQFPGQ